MPTPMRQPRLGDLERTVMDHLWTMTAGGTGEVTVREVLGTFDGQREIAYTTVLTVLDRLEKKGLVTRVRVGRAWRYRPAGTRESLTAATMRGTLNAMEVTDRRAALMHFLDGASEEELADFKAALAEVETRRPLRGLRRPRRRRADEATP